MMVNVSIEMGGGEVNWIRTGSTYQPVRAVAATTGTYRATAVQGAALTRHESKSGMTEDVQPICVWSDRSEGDRRRIEKERCADG